MRNQLKLTYYIYKLECFDPLRDDGCYIGSTASLKTREYTHKSNCNNPTTPKYNFKVYQTIRANGGWDNWKMTAIEELPMHTKIQATIREQHWFALNNCNLNTRDAYANVKGDVTAYNKRYYEAHKEADNSRSMAYYHNNKATLTAINNCPCGGRYQHRCRAKHFTSAIHRRFDRVGVNQVD